MDPDTRAILLLSLKVSAAALAVTLPVAFAVAHALARGRFPGRPLLDLVTQLPLVLPPVVTGWLLLTAFGPTGPIGAALDRVGFTVLFHWTGAAIASGVMALPLMVRALRLSLEAIDPHLQEAAATLGASRWQTLARVTLPLAMPGVLAALVLGFARSLSEFGATITFVSNVPGETRTLPLAIHTALSVPGGEPTVVRLALVSVALAAVSLALAEALARRATGTNLSPGG